MVYQSNLWLPTAQAARALGCSPEHLKRQRDTKGGFLEAQIHYALGTSSNASIAWNTELVRQAMHRRGLQAQVEAN